VVGSLMMRRTFVPEIVPASFFGLTLRFIEVCRDGDDSIADGGAEVRLSGLLHLQENRGRGLFR
jgi:hypothetical protein